MNVMRQSFPIPILKSRGSPAIIHSRENGLANIEQKKKDEQAVNEQKKGVEGCQKEKVSENESSSLIKLQPVQPANPPIEASSEGKVHQNGLLSGLFNNSNKQTINNEATEVNLRPKIHASEEKLKNPSTLFLNRPIVNEEKKEEPKPPAQNIFSFSKKNNT